MSTADLIAIIKKHPLGFACGLICLICAGLIYFTSSQLESGQADYDAKSAEAAKILANVLNSKKLPEQTAEIQTLAKEIDARLIHAGQIAVNQQYFYKLEAETEVKMSDVHQNPPVRTAKGQTSQYTAIPFTVTVQGSFKRLLDFAQRLEDGQHFVRFNSLTFSKGGDATNMSLSFNLEMLGTP